MTAAEAQHAQLPAQAVGARLVSELAAQILNLDVAISRVDTDITTKAQQHPSGAVLMSLPGFGAILAATFIARTR